jgi:hypothetical protein
MDRLQHFIQDDCERYAVYLLQRRAEELGVASQNSSGGTYEEFLEMLSNHGLSLEMVRASKYAAYMVSLETHIPWFIQEIARVWPNETFGFVDVEREHRNQNKKSDFVILRSRSGPVAVSLKNGVARVWWTRGYSGSGCLAGSVGLGGGAVSEAGLVA